MDQAFAFALDIEAANGRILGAGAAVMDMRTRKIIGTWLYKAHLNNMPITGRVWDEFWSKHPDQLKNLLADNQQQPFSRLMQDMINSLLAFLSKWETKADKEEVRFTIVGDNVLFDYGLMNSCIREYHEEDEPFEFPRRYSNSPSGKIRVYNPDYFDLPAAQRALLNAVCVPHIAWGLEGALQEAYDLPDRPKGVRNDHNPANDAVNTLYSYVHVVDASAKLSEITSGFKKIVKIMDDTTQ